MSLEQDILELMKRHAIASEDVAARANLNEGIMMRGLRGTEEMPTPALRKVIAALESLPRHARYADELASLRQLQASAPAKPVIVVKDDPIEQKPRVRKNKTTTPKDTDAAAIENETAPVVIESEIEPSSPELVIDEPQQDQAPAPTSDYETRYAQLRACFVPATTLPMTLQMMGIYPDRLGANQVSKALEEKFLQAVHRQFVRPEVTFNDFRRVFDQVRYGTEGAPLVELPLSTTQFTDPQQAHLARLETRYKAMRYDFKDLFQDPEQMEILLAQLQLPEDSSKLERNIGPLRHAKMLLQPAIGFLKEGITQTEMRTAYDAVAVAATALVTARLQLGIHGEARSR